jgi:cytochrome c5
MHLPAKGIMIIITSRIRVGLFCVFVVTLFFTLSSFATVTSIGRGSRNSAFFIQYPRSNNSQDSTTRQLIKRGEYLSKAGDCIACHTDTKHHGQAFAGGLGIYTPFGTIYSPNITPDKTTGIGRWSDQDFIRAMHRGIAPNGSYYFPVFPFASFTKISKEDLLAIKAYLFSLPPIQKANQANEMMWPFSWRFLQLGWRLLFFRTGEYQHESQQSKEWNRGAYLVQGLGHCGMCHSPLNLLGAEKKKYYLTGGFIEGYYAANITSNGLKDVSLPEILSVFREGKMLKGGGKVAGPMAEVNSNSLSYLSDYDLTAIAAYLKQVKSQTPWSAFTGPITPKTGKKVYQKYCAVCHAMGAAGAPKIGDAEEWQKRLKTGKTIVYTRAIQGFNSMPPKGTCAACSDEAIKTAVDYLIDTHTESTINLPVQETAISLKVGGEIYQKHCAVCHSNGTAGVPQLGDKVAWETLIAKGMDTLFANTIRGYKEMPAKGNCEICSNAELEAGVKYMVEESKCKGNYSLW